MDLLLRLLFAALLVATATGADPRQTGIRRIKTEFDTLLLDDDQVQELIQKRVPFMDISSGGDHSSDTQPLQIRFEPVPFSKSRSLLVRARLKKISSTAMRENLETLTSFRTRY